LAKRSANVPKKGNPGNHPKVSSGPEATAKCGGGEKILAKTRKKLAITFGSPFALAGISPKSWSRLRSKTF